MASSSQRVSASLSSTEPSAPQWKYDVFLSFRGIDTRKGITFELYDGLKNRGGIETFMDDQKLEVGESISPNLLKAIEQSRFAIIVLSRNYASSSWCLEELTKIVDCMKDDNRILPLFYHVEPSDVRHQKRSFEVAFTDHEKKSRHAIEKLKKWKDALKTVASISGWETQNYKTERELVEAIVEFVCDKVQHVGYLADYKSNHQNLQTKLKDLGAARDEVQHKVDQVTRIGGKRIETSVENWMTRVNAIITKAETFLKDVRHGKTECLDGFCPNLELCNQLSKESAKLVEEIVQLYGKKEFSNFAYDVLPQEVCLFSTGHYTAFHSRNSIVASVMNELRSPDIKTILVYGIGGVGKTTIVEEVLRQAKQDNLFDDMVMVRDVKQNPDHEKIQKEIAKKLGMSIVENDTLAERAPKLCDRIQDKRTLIVLDDVWEELDLMAIGLPRLVNCKVVLTCRSRKNLSMDMRTQEDIPLDVLNEEEAWGLFEKMAGEVVKDGRIREVAMKVARKCGGLPLLIVTVARARKGKNRLHAWNDTLRELGLFDKKGLAEKTYLALEWSYDQLEEKELKLLFLLCGIFVDKNHIYLEHLCKYGMGLDLFKNVDTMEEARDLLSTLVEKLIDSCLLFESDKNKYFRMHDLVCEVASRIASRDEHILSVEYGGELEELSLESINIPMLSEVPRECSKLEMFYLYPKAVKSVEIHSNCFSEMEKLKVLGLTKLHMLSIPSSLQFLKNLQTLCLEQCELGDIALVGHLSNLEILSFARSSVKQLPKQIGQLIRLRWLDLSDCYDLEVISPDVISKLERLEDLTMRNSFYKWEAERGGSNASLLELKLLSQLTALEIYIPDADILPTNLFSNKLVRYQIYIGDDVWEDEDGKEKTMAETTLNTLKFKLNASNEWDQGLKTLLKGCEDLSLDGTESVKSIIYQSDIEDFQQLKHLHLRNNVNFTYTIDRKVVFPNLTTLSVNSCDELEFLFSISMAKSLVELKHLNVFSCKIMEEIVSTRDLSNEETIDNIVFCKLESLTLAELPKLARFCTERYIECLPEKKFDTEMGASMCDPRISKKLDVNNETTVQNCLFDAQAKFPSLEKLKIKGTRKLQTIWNNQLADQGSFCELREVDISDCKSLMNMFVPIMMGRLNALETLSIQNCNSLEVVFEIGGTDVEERHAGTSSPHQLRPCYCQSLGSVTIRRCKSLQKIFPALVAKGLQKLYQLKLVICDEVEEIIFGDEGLETTPPQFVFPKVTTVVFSSMHKLSRFYPGMHASKWPLLEYLWVDGCDKVKMFAAELPIKHELDHLIKHTLFLIDKDSFPNLENLTLGVVEIWYGPSSPAHFFPKLKCIEFSDCVCTPFSKQAALVFLHKLHNLDTLKVESRDLEEIFVNEEMNSGGEMEIHAVGTLPLPLPRVKHLNISWMYRLLHLGNHNSHPAGPLFPNLDTLEVFLCDKLKSVESSAISFSNLTSLEVRNCDGLEYLTSYSVAKSLMQLTTLEVRHCGRLREIIKVASNEDDHCEIVFSRLQHLILAGLPRLQGFCSGNCIVKLPSLTELHVDDCRIKLEISSEGVLLCNSNPEPTDEHDFGDEGDTLTVIHTDWEEKLSVTHEDWEEIFVNEEMNSGGEMKIRAVGSLTLPLPRVKRLDIIHMKKLLHLGNHNSQPAGPLLPNLDTVEVFYCPKLKSVESSAISFRNLTTLEVGHCGLEYLTSYSVAKSLMQLTTLEVRHCGRLREIIKVASNEDDHDSCEIAFSQLRRLTLSFLPRLRGFCWGNCIVKLPSSTKLDVFSCGIELEISSQEVLLSKRQRR